MEINTELAELISGLSSAVLKKDSKTLTKDEASFLIAADIASLPTELSIDISDTRKTEVQYCTNTYYAGVKIPLADVKKYINTSLDEISDPTEMVTKYIALKDMYIKFMQFKYASMENFLRDLTREAQKKDKIVPVGRYNSN